MPNSTYAVAVSSKGQLAAATSSRLLVREQGGANWQWYWVDTVIDRDVVSLAYRGDELWVASRAALTVRSPSGRFKRYGFLQGLPHTNLTSMCVGSNVWLGSAIGASMLNTSSAHFRFYRGLRWLNGDDAQVVGCSSNRAFIASAAGLAIITLRPYTLQDKANLLESLVEPRHDRFGLVSDVGLKSRGDVSTYFKRPSDNDGTWTAIYVTSQVFRFAVTHDKAVQQAALRHWRALELLNNVTGIPGFPARSVVEYGTPTGPGEWFNSTAPGYTNWTFKGNTSSDEIVNHINVHPLFADLMAPDADYAARARDLVLRIVDNIIAHNYTLLDPTGKRTRWGFWDPEDLNDDPVNYSERNENSLELLTFFVVAYRLSGNSTYLNLALEFGSKYGYFENALNPYIEVPDDIDYSDTELLYLTYLPLGYNLAVLHKQGKHVPSELTTMFNQSLSRTWALAQRQRSSFYTFVTAAFLPEQVTDEQLQRAIDDLQQAPTELVDWSYDNTVRQDIVLDRSVKLDEVPASVNPVPSGERSCMRWNANPFRLRGGSGFTEYDPGAWLLGYWTGRFFNLIE